MYSRYRFPALLLACCLLFSACARQNAVKSQPISDEIAPRRAQVSSSSLPSEDAAPQEDVIPQESAASQAEVSSSQQAGTSSVQASGEELLAQYYSVKAQEEALEIDIENLEAALRTGKLGDSEFQQKLAEYERQEDALDARKDALEAQIGPFAPYFSFTLPQDREGLLSLLDELERQDDELDGRKDALEDGYRSGSTSREDFLKEYALLEREDDFIGERQDAAERALAALPALSGHGSHSSTHHAEYDDWDDDGDDDDDD